MNRNPTVKTTVIDQCAYGLCLPGCKPNTFCRKTSWFASDCKEIRQIELHCPRDHLLEVTWGRRVVGKQTIDLASAAGVYPRPLVDVRGIAALVDRFSRGQLGTAAAGVQLIR